MDFPEFVTSVSSSEFDDWPNVLVIGSGRSRQNSAEAGLDALIAALKRSGRTVIFDKCVTDPDAIDIARAVSSVNTANLAGSRPICVMRGLDRLTRITAPLVKSAVSRGSNWWICSGATVGGALSGISGAFLTARAPESDVSSKSVVIGSPRDVQAAWASGVDVGRIVEGFSDLAVDRMSPHEAAQRAALLDLDVKRNLRPLLLSAIIEDAVADLLEHPRHIAST